MFESLTKTKFAECTVDTVQWHWETVEDVGTAVFSVPDLINSGCNFIPGVNLYTNYANDFSNWYHEGEEDIIGDNDVFYTTKAVVNVADAVLEGVEIMTVGTVATIIGGGGEVLGVALDSSGALAPAGIPINVASGSLIAAGITTFAYGVEKTKNNIANFEHNVEKAKESYDKPDVTTSSKSEISELKDTENFSDSSLEHILDGTVNKKGEATGYHYDGISDTKGKIIPGTESV